MNFNFLGRLNEIAKLEWVALKQVWTDHQINFDLFFQENAIIIRNWQSNVILKST